MPKEDFVKEYMDVRHTRTINNTALMPSLPKSGHLWIHICSGALSRERMD
jgi:hypothetical protein